MTCIGKEPVSYDHARQPTLPTLGIAKNVEDLDEFEVFKNQRAERGEEEQEYLWDIGDPRVGKVLDSFVIYIMLSPCESNLLLFPTTVGKALQWTQNSIRAVSEFLRLVM